MSKKELQYTTVHRRKILTYSDKGGYFVKQMSEYNERQPKE